MPQGPNFTIVFTFDKAVTAGMAQVTEDTAVAGAPTFFGSEMRVPLTGSSNIQYVTVSVDQRRFNTQITKILPVP